MLVFEIPNIRHYVLRITAIIEVEQKPILERWKSNVLLNTDN
jgi:hypothetical protein